MEGLWEALSGLAVLLFWILPAVLKKMKQSRRRETKSTETPAPRPAKARSRREAYEFKRDYEPIEPS